MSNTVIQVENISKQYRLGEVGTGALSHDINRWWHKIRGKEDPYLKIGEANDRTQKANSEYVWALRDINFEVKQGEILGIIGRNGAGKSTLLKILSRTTTPTTGNIKIKGRVASLLEVGTGFHPELTGRDNIFLNGAILGMSKQEIKRKFDEIVDFAGVERYIDTPVKRYSSGMYVRLAFGVAAHLEPEILIVDEVLAVGDAEFQKKALGKMQDVSNKEGRTVLFVSHNIASIKALCHNGLLLSEGYLKEKNSILNVIDTYSENIQSNFKIKNILQHYNSVKFAILDLRFNGSTLGSTLTLSSGSEIKIDCQINFKVKLKMSIEIKIFDENSNPIAFCSPSQDGTQTKLFEKGNVHFYFNFTLPHRINRGNFYLNFYLANPGVETFLELERAIIIQSQGYANILGNSFEYSKAGYFFFDSKLTYKNI